MTFEDKATSKIDNFQQVGMVLTGAFDARPRDDIARIHVNDDVKTWQRLTNEVSGITDYDNLDFQPLQYTEYSAELHYGCKLTPWITIRPNLQYVWQPGGVKEVDDAFVVGLKLQVDL